MNYTINIKSKEIQKLIADYATRESGFSIEPTNVRFIFDGGLDFGDPAYLDRAIIDIDMKAIKKATANSSDNVDLTRHGFMVQSS